MKPLFVHVWARIEAHVSSRFVTKTGLPFTYVTEGDVLKNDRTEYPLNRSNFEKAYRLVPFDGPGVVNRDVRGPSYVWAILHDSRIRKSDW